MLPYLPTEVIENIIDQAADDDTQTLRNFAITCRDLLPRSRYYLFQFIRLEGTIQLRPFYKLLDQHPHLASFVISLTLSTIEDDPKSMSLLHKTPISLFRRLPNLELWSITDPDADYREPRQWLSFTSPTLTCLKLYATGIVELYLDSVSLLNCAHFVDYILAFQSLKYLYCRSLYFKTGLDDLRFFSVKQRLAGRLQLSTLIIDRDVPDDAARALLESSPSTLSDLELHVREETKLDVPSLVSELHELRSLTLALRLCDTGAVLCALQIVEALSLRPESHLQNLIIRLHEVHFPLLLSMVLEVDSYCGLERYRYHELESVLLRLPKLHNIEVHYDAPRNIDWTVVLEDRLLKFKLAARRSVIFQHLQPSHPRQTSHDGDVSSIVVSPDSKRIASGSHDCTIILWDTQHKSIIHEWIAHSAPISSLAFSPDSRRLASAGHDRKVVVWDTSGLRVKRVAILEGHSDEINTCAWSPDGTTIVSGSNDGTIRIWDARTYQQLHSLQDPNAKPVWFVQLSSDGRWIASGGSGTSCAVWDAIAGDLLLLHGHDANLNNAVFDLTTRRIATASYDRTVRIWDIERGEALVVLAGHTDVVRDVAFSPDGRCVVSGSWDRTAKVWDSLTGDILLSLDGHESGVCAVCFSPDGKYIVSGSCDETMRMWRASDGACIRVFAAERLGDDGMGSSISVVYSLDGDTLATAGEYSRRVRIRRICDVMQEE